MAKLPFSLKPSSWFLKGKDLEIARAYHELTGSELKKRLLEIEYSGTITPAQELEYKEKLYLVDFEFGKYTRRKVDELILELKHPRKSQEFKLGLVDIKLEHGELDEYDAEVEKLGIKHKNREGAEYVIGKANLDRQHNMIDERDYDKTIATANGKPWVTVVDANLVYGGPRGNQMSFDLDWNQQFVDDLRLNGWTGISDSDVVDQWFTNLCMDMMSPLDDFETNDDGTPNITKRTDLGNDKAEYS